MSAYTCDTCGRDDLPAPDTSHGVIGSVCPGTGAKTGRGRARTIAAGDLAPGLRVRVGAADRWRTVLAVEAEGDAVRVRVSSGRTGSGSGNRAAWRVFDKGQAVTVKG